MPDRVRVCFKQMRMRTGKVHVLIYNINRAIIGLCQKRRIGYGSKSFKQCKSFKQ